MCAPTRSKCECEGPFKTVKCFVVNIEQEENKDHAACTERFKQANNVFGQLVHNDWMNEFVKHTLECTATTDTNKQSETPKEGPEKFVAFTHEKQ